MLLFFSIIIIINLIILLILFSQIKIIIDKLELNNNAKIFNYKIKIGIYFLNKIPIFRFKIEKGKSSKIIKNDNIKNKIKEIAGINQGNKKLQIKDGLKVLKIIKKNIDIDFLNFYLDIGADNVFLTSYLVGLISAMLPNILRQNIKSFNNKNYKFKINPIYRNQFYINLKLSSIINIKVVHIINMFKKMGGKKYERTSDRRLNVNCYGKY